VHVNLFLFKASKGVGEFEWTLWMRARAVTSEPLPDSPQFAAVEGTNGRRRSCVHAVSAVTRGHRVGDAHRFRATVVETGFGEGVRELECQKDMMARSAENRRASLLVVLGCPGTSL